VIVDANRWRHLDAGEAAATATEIAERAGARLLEVRAHVFAGRAGLVALFDVDGDGDGDGDTFAFVPGGEVDVGFDPAGFTPTPAQEGEQQRVAAEFGHPADFVEFLGSMTTPRRRVVVPPLLEAVRAHEVRSLDVDSDSWPTYADEVEYLRAEGRRLLSPDEWEHTCGAGAATLFRWGDDHPIEFRPDGSQRGPHRESNAFRS
jgi:hypothetical protein